MSYVKKRNYGRPITLALLQHDKEIIYRYSLQELNLKDTTYNNTKIVTF